MGRITKSSIRPHTACHRVTLQRPALKQSKCIRNFLGDFQMLSKKKKKKKAEEAARLWVVLNGTV